MRKLLCLTGVFALLASSAAYAAAAGKISVTDAWVQAMPPSSSISAAYMTITNNSSQNVVLSSASCDIAGAAEIHQMKDDGGMMRMSMVASLTIPPQGKVTLKPGGYHLMLIDLKKPVNNGDVVPISLHFKDGETIKVNAHARNQ
ncbi:MAG: copper chaperone PCu(A)C [Candidatus Omnitrophica bacterium]|nr:copper chaperone PCu(A)C [Candidatus Omnitrophota bacterium]MDE2222888.1 copper chaperone PCu(A)C [Candidatus Omnitrophota bacterium]